MDMGDIEIIEIQSPVQQFYFNSNVFVTGATGFLGRALIEKLLRSCPDIGNIYVLIKAKYGVTSEERLKLLLEDQVFSLIKEQDKNLMKKIVGVTGDCTLENLGLSAEDQNLLKSNVNVIFHLAGTIKLMEKLKIATNANVSSTYEVLKFCKLIENLRSFVHVSSAFAHSHQNVISEKFYPSPIEPKKLINLARNLNDNLMEDLTSKFLGKFPNTFTYTKAVAEELVREFGKTLPAVIIRPSIVISTYREPHKGWVDNFYGPSAIMMTACCGLLTSLHGDPEKNANLVPADVCVNAMIAIAPDVANTFSNKPNDGGFDVPIYHVETSRDQPIKWREYVNKTLKSSRKWPTFQAVWSSSFDLEMNYFVHLVTVILTMFLPGLLGDALAFVVGRKPWLTKTYRYMFKMTNEFSYFTTGNFTFVSKRLQNLIAKMTPEDKNLFFCDLTRLHWDEYFETYFLGIRTYILKDPVETLSAAREKFRRLLFVHNVLKLIATLILFGFLYSMMMSVYLSLNPREPKY